MKKVILLLFVCYSSFGEEDLNYTKHFYKVHSNFKNREKVPFFVYTSNFLRPDSKVKIILFLHGRGFCRDNPVHKAMLEHLDLNGLFEANKTKGLIILAPQDVFYHEENGSMGQDYWIGKEGRNWMNFLSTGLDGLIKKLGIDLGVELTSGVDTVVGISMGAHGAFLLGRKYPEKFKNVVAISPVFRPVKAELPKTDWDIFKPDDLRFSRENNIGLQILEESFSPPKKLHLLTSNSDFGLDTRNFPKGSSCIKKLQVMFGKDHKIEIIKDNLGHSAKFWKKALKMIKF